MTVAILLDLDQVQEKAPGIDEDLPDNRDDELG